MIATELERQLRPPQLPLAAYPPKSILLANGEELVVREARLEEAPLLLETVYPLIGVSKDFYDIVAARLYAELLGWIRHRTANEFVLVGAVDGEECRERLAAGRVARRGDGARGGNRRSKSAIKR